MKTKWLISDIVRRIIEIIVIIGILILVLVGVQKLFIKSVGIIFVIAVVIFLALLLIYAISVFTVMKFDEKGFYFYDIRGLRGFCPWESIEKAEYHRTKNNYWFDVNKYYRPVYIIVYNSEHFLEPDIDENAVVSNKNRNGRRFKMNCSNSELAWVIGLNWFSRKIFKQYFSYYRPDLFIQYNANMLEDDRML